MIIPVGMHATGTDPIRNSSTTEGATIDHNVPFVSKFKFQNDKQSLEGVDKIKIGKMTVQNNSRDGYTVSVDCNGVLAAAGTEEGEADIEYKLTFTKISGDIGSGSNLSGELLSAALSSGTPFVIANAGNVAAETNAVIEVHLKPDDAAADQLTLAGQYTDSITFTYRDL